MRGPAASAIKGGNQYQSVAPRITPLSHVRRCQKMRMTVITLKAKRTIRKPHTAPAPSESSLLSPGLGTKVMGRLACLPIDAMTEECTTSIRPQDPRPYPVGRVLGSP